jgi:anti-anti-sigma factor
MNLDIETIGRTSTVRVKEKELTYPLLHTFFNSAEALIDSGTRDLVINLSAVAYLDSAALGCLMDIFHHMSAHDGTVKLEGMQERVQTLATMVGLTQRVVVVREEDLQPVSVN